MTKFFKKILIFLAIVFLYFFLFLQHVEKEISYNNVAHIFMLNTLEIWKRSTPLEYHFSPVQTFPEAKKHNHYYKRLDDIEGNNYYISHPPGAFLFNYLIFSFFSLPLSNENLQWVLFSLWTLMLILIFFWINETWGKTIHVYFFIITGLILWGASGPVLYLFSRHNFSEAWGFFFFTGWLIFYDLYTKTRKKLFYVLLITFTLFTAYTDWLGIGLLFVGGWYIIFSKDPFLRKSWFSLLIVLVVTYAMVFIQYASIGGVSAFLKALAIRFVERSGYFGASYTDMGYHIFNLETWKFLILNIWNMLKGGGLFCIILVLVYKLIFKRNILFLLHEKIVVISFLSVLIYSLFLFSATATHYVYIAKWYIPIFFTTMLILSENLNLIRGPWWISLVSLFLIMLAYYEFRLHVPKMNLDKKRYLDELADEVKNNKQDTIVMRSFLEERDIIYLSWKSKRNLVWKNK
ncbi:MAG: hypothetical protein N2Z72_06475 [Bacteroidales bacterium]|nr:hypothetical protein [Bacteroidales bacterium]